jgi:hypothetical protein
MALVLELTYDDNLVYDVATLNIAKASYIGYICTSAKSKPQGISIFFSLVTLDINIIIENIVHNRKIRDIYHKFLNIILPSTYNLLYLY